MEIEICKIWDWADVRAHYPSAPASRAGRHRWQRKHNFPKPVYLTPNHPRWLRDEVVAWFNSRPRSYIQVVEEGRSSIELLLESDEIVWTDPWGNIQKAEDSND
jgi:hypothetical protein